MKTLLHFLVQKLLLQAAIGAGMILSAIFVVYMLIGTPLLVWLLMRVYWKSTNQNDKIKNNTPYYKAPLAFAIVLLISVAILTLLFFVLLLLVAIVYPVTFD